jgi:hypothetical protein
MQRWKTKMSANKLDIFELLRHIDRQDRDFISNLPEEDRKGFVPVVAMRWLSAGGMDAQLLNVNEIVNSTVFSLYKHPELLYRLMVAATPESPKQYNWLKTAKKDKMSMKVDVIRRYQDVSPHEAVELLMLFSDAEIMEMAEGIGESQDFIKKLKSELK